MKRLPLFLGGVAYIVCFLWSYASVVAPAFGNAGFPYMWPGASTMLWVSLLGLIPLTIIPIELAKPSTLVLWWLYVTTYVPSLLMPVITLNMPDSTLFPLQLTVVATMMLLCAVPYAKTVVLPRVVVSPEAFWWTLGLVWVACIAFSLANISASKIIANFALLLAGESEYTLRADFFTQIAEGGRAIAYVGNELSRGIDPFLIAYGLLSKRFWLIAAGVVGQLVFFGETGAKDVLFALLFIVFIYLLFKRYQEGFGAAFLTAICGLILVTTGFDLGTHSATLSTHLTRRTLATPGQLTGDYFEHYSLVPHPGHNFAGTGNFQVYGPPQEIGLYYFGSSKIDANANFWAEGFAEYGVGGIFAFAILIAFMLWIFDSIAATRSLELAVLLVVMQADALSNSTPLTILVTHGGILVGIILYFAPAVLAVRNRRTELTDADTPFEDMLPSTGVI